MHIRTLIMLSALTLSPLSVHAETYSAQDFVTKASTANQFEIDAATLALQKSQNADIRELAETIKADHEIAGRKLAEVVKTSHSKDKTVRPDLKMATGLDKKHEDIIENLQAASESDFDEDYLESQAIAHREAVSLFAAYAKNGKDVELKNFANETLPTLQRHLNHVKELRENE